MPINAHNKLSIRSKLLQVRSGISTDRILPSDMKASAWSSSTRQQANSAKTCKLESSEARETHCIRSSVEFQANI
eukprot:m.29233 g.29233  ORF g.29233 m.29233 type:complete len:75 (+) comp31151_c0_seq2:72-296(+)